MCPSVDDTVPDDSRCACIGVQINITDFFTKKKKKERSILQIWTTLEHIGIWFMQLKINLKMYNQNNNFNSFGFFLLFMPLSPLPWCITDSYLGSLMNSI